MVEYGEPASDRCLAQVAAERHPEAYAAELPESWAGHDVEMVPLPQLWAWRTSSESVGR
jgi:hypothetical protein